MKKTNKEPKKERKVVVMKQVPSQDLGGFKVVPVPGQRAFTTEGAEEFQRVFKALAPEHKSFNRGPTLCVTIPEELGTADISVNFRGRQITFSFIQAEGGVAECVDIKVHNTPETAKGGNGQPLPVQHWILWKGGDGRFDTRQMKDTNPPRQVTLGTLLLNPDWYGEKQED